MWKAKVTKDNFYSRLDRFLRRNLPEVPLSAIYKFIRKGKVYVNGKRVKNQSYKITVGDVVEVRYVDVDKYRKRKENNLEPQKIDLDILYEDDYILVINKSAGIAVHPGKNIHVVTLIEGLIYYGNERGFQPHLVHRLDLNTSGVFVVAKDKETARILTDMFKKRLVHK
jgi:23S rRNA pseudouridine955/2504/2580 synthase